MNSHADQTIAGLKLGAQLAEAYLQQIHQRHVAPKPSALTELAALDCELPEQPTRPSDTLSLLDRAGSPATVATTGGRFFGLVVGGALPATVGSRVLNAAWDQLATTQDCSPVALQLERTAARWLLDLLRLPAHASVGYVTGTTMGNFTCLAAARHRQLQKLGWDVEQHGLYGAPPLRVIASEEIHVTVTKVLSLLGLGKQNVLSIETDSNGAMRADKLPELGPDCIVLTQAGNVNSGAIDPIGRIAERAHAADAWVHVDGAFGLWARVNPELNAMTRGIELADSWVTDAHKWLNTPYDCGVAICRHSSAIHAAMSTVAPYFTSDSHVAPKDMVPELSRSARAMDVWAALHSLGREGLGDLIQRCCRHAQMAAHSLRSMGFDIVNDVVLNQVVVSHPTDHHQLAKIAEIVQRSGEAWFGVTHWKQRDAFRLSFSSWATTDEDLERLLNAIQLAARQLGLK
ncbi:aspartate aminotransferase family protein [Arenicella chitinivorans]|uniref:Aspartate aminotransferase family protein n=1 Tax=Arenicella chitinivorans TaxID=1329800 RepID=A0A918RIR7_9GAMM|nr:pyridoxal-dependent decarboxylase [Arenicella chitinivorans]GHA00427.1 aspartate aminotransferase family protein [Arenicella chitinivorans]